MPFLFEHQRDDRQMNGTSGTRRALRGVLPVFQTPYHDDESIDYDTLDREIGWLFDQGADGVVMAMVSEVLRLATDEREQMAARVCRVARPHGVVVISTGAESGHVAERLSRHAESAGADAIMAIPPVSIPLREDELSGYYRRILNSVRIPVIVQDASGYVGKPMSIGLQARLFDEFGERVMFKPEAAPIGPRLSELLEATGGRAQVFEGSGGIALVDSFRRGVVGTMPGADLVDAIVALWSALQAGDESRIEKIAKPLCALVSLQTSLDAFLAIEKYVLLKRGIFKNACVRGPVGYRLDEPARREVDRLLDLLLDAMRS